MKNINKPINNFFALIVIITLSFSCREETNKHELDFPYTIKINISDAITDSMDLSQIAKKIEYIPLQTTDSSVVDYFNDYVVTKDYFFIIVGLQVFIFDKQGEYVGKLFNVGRGPEESSAQSITVSEKERLVYVLESGNKGLTVYNFDRKYIKSINKPINLPEHWTWAIGYFNHNLLLANAQRPRTKYLYSLYDLISDTIRILYKNNREYTSSQLDYPQNPITAWDYHFQIMDSLILLKERFCDTIYSVNSAFNISPRYIIDLGNYKCTWEDWRDNYMFHNPRSINTSIPTGYYIQSFVESDSFLFFVLISHSNPELFVVYNKKTNLVNIYSRVYSEIFYSRDQVFIKNNIDSLAAFPPMNQKGYMIYYDNCLFSIIEAGDFVKAYQKASNKIKNESKYPKEMIPVLSKIDEFSNPIIMKVYLK